MPKVASKPPEPEVVRVGRRQLCTCSLICAKHTSEDPVTKARVKGLYVTPSVFKKHQNAVYQMAEAARQASDAQSIQAIYSRILSDAPPSERTSAGASLSSSLGQTLLSGSGQTAHHLESSSQLPQAFGIPAPESGGQTSHSTIGSTEGSAVAGPSSLNPTVSGPPPLGPTSVDSSMLDPDSDAARSLPDVVALEQEIAALRDLQRAWREPLLVFHGPFESRNEASTNCVPFLRHNDSTDNYRYLESRVSAVHLQKRVASYEVQSPAAAAVKEQALLLIDQWIMRVNQVAADQWNSQRLRLQLYAQAGIERVETSAYFYDFEGIKLHQLCGMLTVLVLYLLRGLSRSSSRFLLGALEIIFYQVLASACAGFALNYTTLAASVTSGWAVDIRQVLTHFNLDPLSIEFAMCKRCNALYPLDPRHHSFRERCNLRGCNGLLFSRIVYEENRGHPLLSFHYQSPIAWVGRLLSRRSILSAMITAPSPSLNPADFVRDFWGATAVQELMDIDGSTPFFPLNPIAGQFRLAFGLFVDWFSPFGSRRARHYSVGAIYLVCMNLPPEIRYRVENICLIGVIPGPKEPRLQNLHHLLAPLVDDLLRLWSPGVILSRTAFHVDALVRAALLPLIADTPALRKTVGLKSSNSNIAPCSLCDSSVLRDNFSWWSWPRRSWAYHLEHATRWLHAGDDAAREEMAKETGVRWSELLRLPYWDPTKYAVIDAMHNLFLGDLLRHLEIAWGMHWKQRRQAQPGHDSDAGSDSGMNATASRKDKWFTPEMQTAGLRKVVNALVSKSFTALHACRHDYLTAVALCNGVSAKGFKADIAKALLAWYEPTNNARIRVPNPHPYDVTKFELDDATASASTVVLGNVELDWIWPIASRISLPSWVDRGPQHFGKPGQGNIKADQWRTIGTILLPLVLIHQWAVDGYRYDDLREPILANFLDLVAAVNLASTHLTSEDRRRRYLDHLESYARGLRDLFPNYEIPSSLHQSFHLPEFLRAFGPVRGWWSFPFERYNGIMRKIPHNGRRGLLETTFFWNFCRACNLRDVMERLAESGLLPDFCRLFERVFGSQAFSLAGISPSDNDEATSAGEQSADNQGGNVMSMSREVLAELAARFNHDIGQTIYTSDASGEPGQVRLSPEVTMLSHFSRYNIRYAHTSNSKTDCDVVVRSPGSTGLTAGRLTHIFRHTRPDVNGTLKTETFAYFMPFQPLTAAEAVQDPYRRYEDVGAMSFHNQLLPPVVIKADDVAGHFAGLVYNWKLPPADGSELPKSEWAPKSLLAIMSLARD